MLSSPFFRLAVCLAIALPALAGQTGKRALIDEMLTLTNSQAIVETVVNQQQAALEQKLQQIVDSSDELKPYAKDLKPILADFETKTIDIIRKTLDWGTLRPQIVSIYEDVFTEEDLKGAIAFYRTPAGQAVLKKMPELMTATTKLVQDKLEIAMPQVNTLGVELRDKLNKLAAEKPKAN